MGEALTENLKTPGEEAIERMKSVLDEQQQAGHHEYTENPPDEEEGLAPLRYVNFGGKVTLMQELSGYQDKGHTVYTDETWTTNVGVSELEPDGTGTQDAYCCRVNRSLKPGSKPTPPEYFIERRTGTVQKNLLGKPRLDRDKNPLVEIDVRTIPTDRDTFLFHQDRVLGNLATEAQRQSARATSAQSMLRPK